jgi:hypothetical protein
MNVSVALTCTCDVSVNLPAGAVGSLELGAAAVSVLVGSGTAAAVGASVLVAVVPLVAGVPFFLFLLMRALSLSMRSDTVGWHDMSATKIALKHSKSKEGVSLRPAISASGSVMIRCGEGVLEAECAGIDVVGDGWNEERKKGR